MDAKTKQELTTHVKDHMNYPATKQQIMAACSQMAHVPQAGREWAAEKLADRTYASANEVLQALGL